MPVEMVSRGITFTVQWKKKSGIIGGNGEVTSLGLWDTDDSTLDWQTFKSYVCQNLGTAEHISVAYVDSEGDELPIESECEFREALKFARQRARKGRDTVLRVERQNSENSSMQTSEIPQVVNNEKAKSSLMSCTKQKIKTGIKSSHKSSANGKSVGHLTVASDEKKSKETKNRSCINCDPEHTERFLTVLEKLNKINLDQGDAPPQWFRRYMLKMKNDIVTEVTNNILHEIQQVFPVQRDCHGSKNSSSWSLNKNKKKKKLSDEESSDGALGCESRDHKLLKKIEKLHKREKKLEKKLDSKLEKLENKTKRMMEKRSQCKARCEKIPERKLCTVKRRSGDIHFGTYLMDAILLNEGPASEISISPCEHFTKVWEIMNAGTLPWTDKTELRQAWGTSGLEPEETVVKCPILQPGDQGTISMKFRAPEFPGKFKSYWHFYHMGDRFGHWIGCAVVVKDSKEEQPSIHEIDENGMYSTNTQNDHTVDLSVKKKSDVSKLQQHNVNECEQKNGGSSVRQREEYDSDFESDNLSVISGPGSESSDSDDENFVVIPMPACFVCDVPLGHAETVPIVVKSDLKELKPANNTKSERFEAVEDDSSHENKNPLDDDVVAKKTYIEDEQYADRPLEKVYAVNSSGCCIAVKYCSESGVYHSNATTSQSSSSLGSCCSERQYPCEPKPQTDQKEENNACSTNYSKTFHSETNQTTADNSHHNVQGNTASSSDTSKHPSTGSLGQDPLTNVIHILPETLVTGAVNVASSAISTARAVISNLRTRQHEDGANWQWRDLPGSDAQPTDSTAMGNLERLIEMGFNNRILNVLLLQRYDNDLIKVVAELVSYEE